MAGPKKKDPGTAVNKRNGHPIQLEAVKGERFEPDIVLRDEAQRQWDQFWADPISNMVTPADRGMLERWIAMVNRYWYLVEEADRNPLVDSRANGQMANPLYTTCSQLENSIARIEQQLGIGTRNRATLGIQIIEERKSMAKINQRYEPGGDDGREEDDPRKLGNA